MGFAGSTTVRPGWAKPLRTRHRLPARCSGNEPQALLAQIASLSLAQRRWSRTRAVERSGTGNWAADRLATNDRPRRGGHGGRSPRYCRRFTAQADRSRRFAERSVFAGRCCWSRRTGVGLGPGQRAAQRGGFQLLPSATGWPVRRSPIAAIGSRSHRSRSSRSSSARSLSRRSRALEAEAHRHEADLAAALARECCGFRHQHGIAGIGARRVAQALAIRSAAISFGAVDGDERRRALPLRDADSRQIATLLVPHGLPADTAARLHTQVVPALEALSQSRFAATRFRPKRSRRRCSGAVTTSRPPCCEPSRTTCVPH